VEAFIAYSAHELASHCVEIEDILNKESVLSKKCSNISRVCLLARVSNSDVYSN